MDWRFRRYTSFYRTREQVTWRGRSIVLSRGWNNRDPGRWALFVAGLRLVLGRGVRDHVDRRAFLWRGMASG